MAAADAGYSILLCDGISHEWDGKKGILEYHDTVASYKGVNSYTAWRRATPKHDAFVEALIRFPGHMFATCRAKLDYAMETGADGKTTIRELGMGPIQRDSTKYAVDIWATIDDGHVLTIGGSRCRYVSDKIYRPEEVHQVGPVLARWVAGTINIHEPVENPKISQEVIDELKDLGEQIGMTDRKWYDALSQFRATSFGMLEPEAADRLKKGIQAQIDKKKGGQNKKPGSAA
jgi:hypothetical protein